MSETEHHIGKLIEIFPIENENFENFILRILKENNESIEIPSYYDNTSQYFNDVLHEKYFIYNDKVFKVENKSYDCDDEIIEAYKEQDGSISYQLRFYNGGGDFKECLEEALNKMK